MNADRNLLFGILALQMDFIGRDQLVKAMNDWALDKSKPLGEILVGNEALSQGDHALLDPMVERHVQLHKNDVVESLAAVSLMAPIKSELETIVPVEVATSLQRVSTQVENYVPPSPADSLGVSTSAGTRFQILRPHARGGLGQVSLARDAELNREVALKEIVKQHANDMGSRSRFNLEAMITGGLEHPGIVPVYGLGQYDDGRPFYAMRFIRGETLDHALKQYHETAETTDSGNRLLAVRALLGRIIDVCNAIQYAHSKGVLHRDLKPSNIMLGKYGETLVVDWGVAKVQGEVEEHSEEDPLDPNFAGNSVQTQTGSTVGTPGFMSPEQAGGRLDDLGPTSDIYSIGATLYAVLTGKPAITGELWDILVRTTEGRFARPNEVQPGTPPALEAICLKAMATKPQDRYESAQGMASDLERFLADEPVAAYPEPFALRARRFVRKHQTLAGTTAAIVLLSAISLAALFVIVSGKNAQMAEKNIELSTANARLDLQKTALADRNADLKQANDLISKAEQKARIETENSKQVSKFLLGLFEDTDPIAFGGRSFGPSVGAAKDFTAQDIVDRGANKLEDMLLEQPAVRAQLLDKIGAVYLSLGLPDKAEPLLMKGLELRKQLYDPNDKKIAHEAIASSLMNIGHMRSVRGELGGDELRTALAYREELSGPNSKPVADAQFHLGLQILLNGMTKEAKPIVEAALVLLKTHYGEESREYAFGQFCMGYIMLEQSDNAGATFIKNATSTIDRLEGNTDFGDFIGAYMMARLQERSPFLNLAVENYQKSIEKGSSIFGEQHGMVLKVRGDYAELLSRLNNHEKADEEYRVLLNGTRELYGESSRRMTSVLQELSDHYKSSDRFDKAEQAMRDSLEISTTKKYTGYQIDALHSLAKLVVRRDPFEAEGLMRKAIAAAKGYSDPQDWSWDWMYDWLSYVLLKQIDEPSARILIRWSNQPAETVFKKACLHAKAMELIGNGEAELSGGDINHKSYVADRAVRLLKQAFDDGFKDINLLKASADLQSLRSREDFKKLVTRLEQGI